MGRYISNSFGSCKGGYVSPFVSGGGFDPDAEAFIVSAAITDPTEQSAINQLVLDLKTYLIWNKIIALYPFVGSTALSCSYNLKNTNQYQITWYGGMSFSANGASGNGANGYGDTGIVESSYLTINDLSMSCYVRTSFTSDLTAIGLWDGTNTTNILPKYANQYFGAINNGGFPAISAFETSQGLFLLSRDNASNFNAIKNSSLVSTPSVPSTSLTNLSLYIFALNYNNNPINYANFEMASVHVGTSMTLIESANFYTAIQTFQTSLNRQV